VPRFNRGGSEKGERAGVERRRGERKKKVEGMTEGRGRKEGMGNSDGGNCATAPRGIDATAFDGPSFSITFIFN